MQKLIIALILVIIAIQITMMIMIKKATASPINNVVPATPAKLATSAKLPTNLEEIMEVNKWNF